MENQINSTALTNEELKALIVKLVGRKAKTKEMQAALKAHGVRHTTAYRINTVMGRIARTPDQTGNADNLTEKKALLLAHARAALPQTLPCADQYLLNLIGEARTPKGAVERVSMAFA